MSTEPRIRTRRTLLQDSYPVVHNHAAQTGEVEALGRELLPGFLPGVAAGEVVGSQDLPMAGAEDFSYFLLERHGGKPGCFFFLGGQGEAHSELAAFGAHAAAAAAPLPPLTEPGAFAKRPPRTNCICHGTAYDFNDNLIPVAAVLWVRLVERRLGVRLYGSDELGPEAVHAAVALAAAAL